MNSTNKVILFSTRFLEKEDKLFCKKNINDQASCYSKSDEFVKFFLDGELSNEVTTYFNKLYCKHYFSQYKLDGSSPNVDEKDDWNSVIEKVKNFFSEKKDLIDLLFDDILYEDKLITIKEDESDLFNLDDRTFDDNDAKENVLFTEIKKNIGTSFNNISLNTDFGDSIEIKTIERRFKIYKLNLENVNQIEKLKGLQAVFGVWCLRERKDEKEWYRALYYEIKDQMGQDFKNVDEVILFLHDGDLGEKTPFSVKHYKEEFDFVDDGKKLSVALFQHSLSPIAYALSNPNISEALEFAQDAIEKESKLSFLNKLSDCISYWHDGGKEEFFKILVDKEKYGIKSLIIKDNLMA